MNRKYIRVRESDAPDADVENPRQKRRKNGTSKEKVDKNTPPGTQNEENENEEKLISKRRMERDGNYQGQKKATGGAAAARKVKRELVDLTGGLNMIIDLQTNPRKAQRCRDCTSADDNNDSLAEKDTKDVTYTAANALLRQLRVEREIRKARKEASLSTATALKQAFSAPCPSSSFSSSSSSLPMRTAVHTTGASMSSHTITSSSTNSGPLHRPLNLLQYQQKHARLYEQRQKEAEGELRAAEEQVGLYTNGDKSPFRAGARMHFGGSDATDNNGSSSRDKQHDSHAINRSMESSLNSENDHASEMSEG